MPELKLSTKNIADRIGQKQAAAQARLQAEIDVLNAAEASAHAIISEIGRDTLVDIIDQSIIAAAVDVTPTQPYVATMVSAGFGSFSIDLGKDMAVEVPQVPYRAYFFLVPKPPEAEPQPVDIAPGPEPVDIAPAPEPVSGAATPDAIAPTDPAASAADADTKPV